MSRRPSAPKTKPVVPGSRSLDRLEQVRVLAHPLRLSLLELFAESPRTTKQAADRLGLPATRLYHHVAALERVGLVRVRERRPNRGTIEKHYEVVAHGFEADPEQLMRGAGKGNRAAAKRLAHQSVAALAMRILDRAGEGLLKALDAIVDERDLDPEDARRPVALQAAIFGTPDEVVAKRNEVLALIERWKEQPKVEEKEAEAGATMRAALTIVFAPEVPKVEKGAKKSRASGSGGRKPGGGT